MFRITYSKSLLTIALLMIAGIAALAQTQPVRGRIEMKGADGKNTPVADALVEVFRTDVKSKFPSDKTDKKGAFTFAGLPIGADFVLSVSGPGISPDIIPNVRAGREDLVIVVLPGDGKRWTEEEVRSAVAKGAGGNTVAKEESAEEKKAREELEKKTADIKAKNEKAMKANELQNSLLKEGNAAFAAKDWTLAITKYEEGFNVDPEFAGGAGVMLNNRSAALNARAEEVYNKAVQTKSPIGPAREAVKNDTAEIISGSEKLLKILAGASSTDAQTKSEYDAQRYKALWNRKNAFRLMTSTSAELTRGKEALTAFQEYMAVETDAAKKAKAQLDLAETLRESMEFDMAVAEYQKVLDADATNMDAVAGMGLCMVAVGFVTITGDPDKNLPADEAKGKKELQEAANLLQRFVDGAPQTHKLYQSVKDSIAELKNFSVAPQKGVKPATTTKKRN